MGILKKGRWKWVLAAALLTVGIICFRTFSTTLWNADPNSRKYVVDSIISKHKIIGMTEQDIVALLGPEDERGKRYTTFKNHTNSFPPEDTLVYFLGTDFMEGLWLIIRLDNGAAYDILYGIS